MPLAAASAWVISREVTCKKISHFVSGDNTRGRLRPPFSLTDSSSRIVPGDCQRWAISRWTLRGELRRKPRMCSRARSRTRPLPGTAWSFVEVIDAAVSLIAGLWVFGVVGGWRFGARWLRLSIVFRAGGSMGAKAGEVGGPFGGCEVAPGEAAGRG